jgi:hypothetical protein
MRSVVTFIVQSRQGNQTKDIGRLYALVSVVEGIGSLLAGPGVAFTFRYGMSLGQNWLGLPFGLAFVLFTLVSMVVFAIRV